MKKSVLFLLYLSIAMFSYNCSGKHSSAAKKKVKSMLDEEVDSDDPCFHTIANKTAEMKKKTEDFFVFCYKPSKSDTPCFDPFDNSSQYQKLTNCGSDMKDSFDDVDDLQILFIPLKKQSHCSNIVADFVINTQDLNNYSKNELKRQFNDIISSAVKDKTLPCNYTSSFLDLLDDEEYDY